jgi:hypothetical protein
MFAAAERLLTHVRSPLAVSISDMLADAAAASNTPSRLGELREILLGDSPQECVARVRSEASLQGFAPAVSHSRPYL